MEGAKKKFEQDRDQILSTLPESIKCKFGQIGFAPSEENELELVPVLIVSPYDVPPKPVRDIYWYQIYVNAKRKKKLDQLNYLVYFYGSDDFDDCYSFVAQNDLETYEQGREKGLDRIPQWLQEKIETGTPLDENEEARVRAINEMNEDLSKDPSERKRGKTFQETYEKSYGVR